MKHNEIKEEAIKRFREEYSFLSNFYPALIEYEGVLYYSSEAIYQAYKCKYPKDRAAFYGLRADEAKKLGSCVELREDWEDIRLELMKRVVFEKFSQNPYLAEYLLKTENRPIFEGNDWGDVFWGVDLQTGEGENHLGRILMELRAFFRENGIKKSERNTSMKVDSGSNITLDFCDISQTDCEGVVDLLLSNSPGIYDIDDEIRRAAGDKLAKEFSRIRECDYAQAFLTAGGNMRAKSIFHIALPHYEAGEKQECERLLRQSYESVLNLAKKQELKSVAFTCVSEKKMGYPVEDAVRIAVSGVREWMKENGAAVKLVFAVNDIIAYRSYRAALENIAEN